MIAERPILPLTKGPIIYQSNYALKCACNCSFEATIISWLYQLSDNWKNSLDTVRKSASETHWLIFVAYLITGQSSRQLAERFGTTPINVRVITHRIRSKLNELHGDLTDIN